MLDALDAAAHDRGGEFVGDGGDGQCVVHLRLPRGQFVQQQLQHEGHPKRGERRRRQIEARVQPGCSARAANAPVQGWRAIRVLFWGLAAGWFKRDQDRSEEHTSELQSREKLVCRLLLEKKKKESN